jgi:hypothetical protein
MIKNRTAQLIYQTVYCTLALVGSVACLGIFDDIDMFRWDFYTYFTNISNFLCFGVMIAALIQTVKKKENLSIVVLLMDIYTGEIIAAEKAKVGEEKLTAIDTVAKSEMNASISATEGAVIVNATRATAQIYSLDGKLLATQSVNGTATIPTNGWSGTIIVRVENGNDVVVKKVVL